MGRFGGDGEGFCSRKRISQYLPTAIPHIAKHLFREVRTPPKWYHTPVLYSVSHRHICAITHLAAYCAIIAGYPKKASATNFCDTIWQVPKPPGSNPLVAERAPWRSSRSCVTGGHRPIGNPYRFLSFLLHTWQPLCDPNSHSWGRPFQLPRG